MDIEERMVRREPEDIIEIGRALETFYDSSAGSILRAMVNGRVALESKEHKENDRVKPSRVLGRIEAYHQILDDIEMAIGQYRNLIQPLPENAQEGEQ